jgi:hypothetical protein
MSAHAPASNQYQEISKIRSGEIICIVTEHVPTKRRSFMFAKEYARDGRVTRTSFLNSRHVDDVMKLLQEVQGQL